VRDDDAHGTPVDHVAGPAGARRPDSGEGGQASSPGHAGGAGGAADSPDDGVDDVVAGDLLAGDLLADVAAAAIDERFAEAGNEAMTVESALALARDEARGHLDDLLRLKAEFENYRKRVLREQTALAASASRDLVRRLLPVLDNFELAVSSAEQSKDFDKMVKGVEMVYGELREVLRSEGLEPIEAAGRPFDPERHEAVVAVDAEGVDEGTVVGVVRNGYELGGKVLRPAMVKVAR